MEPWELLKGVVEYAIYPAVLVVAFFMRKHIARVDKVEAAVNEQNTRLAVVESKVDDIRMDIKDIKQNVQRLVARK